MRTSSMRSAAAILFLFTFLCMAAAQTAQPNAAVKQLGSVQKIDGSSLVLATDQGATLAVHVQSGARIVRLAPGQTDLKSATPIPLSNLQAGDRVLLRGRMADATLEATAVVVMKQQDIAHAQQQELLDWQRRSVGGVVKQVDAATGRITLMVAGKTVMVTTSPKTSYKRYAPDSVRWEDAAPANLADVHPGDQLRAKGEKNEEGSEVAAEQIVAGTFRNIAGLVTALDAAQGTLTVQDLATKKTVRVKITADSQMKVLPPQLAQGLAMRMKGPAEHAAQAPAGGAPGSGRSRNGDLNQLLSRLPAATLADLKQGEAVMVLSTEGSAAALPTAITLLGGVEPLLTASPAGSNAQSLLTPWSLASAPGGDQ